MHGRLGVVRLGKKGVVESRTIISVYMITSEVCVCVVTLVDTGGVRVKIGGDEVKIG